MFKENNLRGRGYLKMVFRIVNRNYFLEDTMGIVRGYI